MKSMTGFAQGRYNYRNFSLFISFKSYNNRYLETSVRGSGVTAARERFIRDMMKDKVQRGKIEVVLDLVPQGAGQWDIRLNLPLLEAVVERLEPLCRRHGIQPPLDSLLKLPTVLHIEHDPERMDKGEEAALRRAVARVFASFLDSRRQEGLGIQRDLLAAVATIESQVAELRAREKELERSLFASYRRRIAKFLDDLPVDEKRIAQEAAISADKVSITEEVNRLKTHVQRLRKLLQDRRVAGQGKEADFLTQEMQRETHTIAAKTASLDIHRQILLVRREIEKIRQQVQNVE